MTVLFIVLLHAVPVFLIGAMTGSKIGLFVAAIIAGFIGVATGNPAYMFADLIGVAIAFGLGLSFINSQTRSVIAIQNEEVRAQEAKKEEGSSWIGGFIGFGVLAAFLYAKTIDTTPTSPPPVMQAPTRASVAPKQPQQVHAQQTVLKSTAKLPRKSSNSDLRHCLALPSDAAISRCVNQAK